MKIALLISTYKDIEKLKFLINYFDDKNFIILVHINAKSNNKMHSDIKEFSKNKIFHIITSINVYWSHLSHVMQKINTIIYLNNNKIEYDYFINITESDCPIKTKKEILFFFNKNKNVSFFFDYHPEKDKINFYCDLLIKYKKECSKKEYVKKCLKFLNEEILLSDYSLSMKWKWWLHPRNINDSGLCKKKLILKKYILNFLNLFNILKLILNPNRENYIKAQKWYFSQKIKNKELKFYSEWQYSITSFFSKKYCNFINDNWSEHIKQFESIYAPDESFWISIAKNFSSEVGKCEFNWKPLILGTFYLLTNKEGNVKPKLSWSKFDLSSISVDNPDDICFLRKVNNLNEMMEIIQYIESKKRRVIEKK